MESIVLNVLSVVVQTAMMVYFLIRISSVIEDKKYSKKQIILALLIILLCNTFTTTLKVIQGITNVPANVTFTSTSFAICMLIVLKVPFTRALLLVISGFLLFAMTEIMVIYIGMFTLGISSLDIFNSLSISVFLIVCQTLLNFILTQLICRGFEKLPNYKDLFGNIKPTQIINFIILIIPCVLPQILLLALNLYDYSIPFLFINSIQMIIICITMFIFLKRTLERDKTQSDLITSEIHNRTMVGMVDGVRTLKHDYNNIMQALNGYVSTKQYDKLQEHINKVLKECNIVNNLSVIDPNIFNDPAIYGIVGAKYFLACEADITFDLDVITNIKDISFPMPELSRILGILLDNAIEATNKVENKYIRLEMKYDNRKGADVIRVVNTYDTSIQLNLIDIYKKGVSSKKEKSGIGLWEVKKLVSKARHSQVFATIEKDKFVQNLIIEKI